MLLGTSTYIMLWVVHLNSNVSPLVAFVGSLVHTVVYVALGSEAAGCALLFHRPPAPMGSPYLAHRDGAHLHRDGGGDGDGDPPLASACHLCSQAQFLALAVAAGLWTQGLLTATSVIATGYFFEHFAAIQTSFVVAELGPALLLLLFLCERPSNYMHHIAPAA